MNRADFSLLYRYNDWANDRLLGMLEAAFGPDADICKAEDRRIHALQETTVHIVAAQKIWRERWEGFSPAAMLAPQDYPSLPALRTAFEAERLRFWDFFQTLQTEEDLSRIVHSSSTSGEPRIFPLWQMMQHVITHSAYHRGQITARLLDLDFENILQSTDLIAFHQEQNLKTRD